MVDHLDDFSMAYIDSSDQTAVLLIHGFPLHSGMWTAQIDDLAQFVRVIAPDLRGHGASDAAPPPYSVSGLARDCVGLMEHLAVRPPFIVCGLSMGGYVALELYRQFPELVAGLILVSTRAGADSDEAKANRDKTAVNVQDNGVQILADAMLPKLLAPANVEADPELADYVREIIGDTSVEGAVGALQAMRDRPDSVPMLGDITVPTLIIHGADDQLIPPSEAELMHKAIPGSKLVLIEGAAHLPNLERPVEFNDAVIDFLEEIGAGLTAEA
jgi:pimeloyl-ACP methyl ester carboxylesterase